MKCDTCEAGAHSREKAEARLSGPLHPGWCIYLRAAGEVDTSYSALHYAPPATLTIQSLIGNITLQTTAQCPL